MAQNSTSLDLQPHIKKIARIMGGEAHGDQASVPGPGHSPKDRSLSIKLDPSSPAGFRARYVAQSLMIAIGERAVGANGVAHTSRSQMWKDAFLSSGNWIAARNARAIS